MHDAVRTWLEKWQAAINARDYEAGAALFDESVIAFGTYSDAMHGRDKLVADQWREMWPYIKDFRFTFEELSVLGDGVVVAICPWTSLGLSPEGRTFPRAGRCTIVLRESEESLLAVHTHFSMSRGSVARIRAA